MITLTDSAINQVKKLLDTRGKFSEGIRISVQSKGCSGLSYVIEFVDEMNDSDEKVKVKDLNIFVDLKLYVNSFLFRYFNEPIKSLNLSSLPCSLWKLLFDVNSYVCDIDDVKYSVCASKPNVILFELSILSDPLYLFSR